MVEFGLKLEDNKVALWNNYYIQYEKLKKILKKASAAQKKYDDLAKRDPLLAEKIKDAHEKGDGELDATPRGSERSFRTQSSDDLSPHGSSDNILCDENTSLLQQKEVLQKANSTGSTGSIRSGLEHFVSGLYLGKSYEKQIESGLKDIEKIYEEFETSVLQNLNNVNTFYKETLDDLDKRHSLLVESVVASIQQQTRQLKEEKKKKELEEKPQKRVIKRRYSLSEVDEELEPLNDVLENEEEHKSESDVYVPPPTVTRLVQKTQTLLRQYGQKSSKKPRMSIMLDQDDLKSLRSSGGTFRDRSSFLCEHNIKLVLHDDVDDDIEADIIEKEQQEAGNNMNYKNIMMEADSIQRALFDEYRRAKLLQNFAIMNYTGFVKIIKKYDKTTTKERKGKFEFTIASANVCNGAGKDVEQLTRKIENRYAKWFCDGNVRQAVAQLLPKQGDGLQMDWSQLRLGYRLGMCAILSVWIFWDCVWGLVSDGNSTIGGRTAFPVFRACGGLLLLQWFWGCSVFIWTRYRVNYIYLFDFDPRIVSSALSIFNNAVDNTLIFLMCMLLYYKSGAHDMPQLVPDGTYPFVLVVITVLRLIFPLKTRLPMWRAIWDLVTAPMNSPTFFHGYVGDIFTSMVKVFQDIAWTICFVFSGDWLINEDLEDSAKHLWAQGLWYKNVLIPLICLLPLWFRFNQCLRRYMDTGKRFPHLANAGKYALSQTVTLFGAFHPLYLLHKHQYNPDTNWFQIFWMTVFVASSLYSFTWDVYMDWGLGRPEHSFLGPRLMYPGQFYYYVIIMLDLVLRFMWVLTLIPPQSGAEFEIPQYLCAITMMLELIRRTMWGFLRLENEHRSNADGHRRVDFVPLHFNTGHGHQYTKEEKENDGYGVLAEVAFVTLIVLCVCVYSVIAARRGAADEY